MKWWNKLMRNIVKPEESRKLKEWKDKYERATSEYSENLQLMDVYDKMYAGDRHVNRNPNYGGGQSNVMSVNVRNITFDLIESEVDSAIPFPKVIPIHAEDEEQAKILEAFLRGEIDKQHFKAKNDVQERTTPVQGGSFNIIEWDNSIKTHCAVGDLAVNDLHPKQVIPQEGVTELEKMDYVFVRSNQTKDYIKRRFNKDVDSEEGVSDGEDKPLDNIVELVTVYYKNKDGGIGLYRWVGDVEIEDLEDYEERRIKKCKECGETVVGDECPHCGSKKFEVVTDEMDIVKVPIPLTDEAGNTVIGIDGTPIFTVKEVEIPYYKPGMFPIVLRKNISKYKSFLGFSDAAAIEDQQDTIKKLGSKINEKLLKAGSILTMPNGVQFQKNEEEFKILRIDNPQQLSMIQVVTCQADVSKDMSFLEINYQWAKSALGITDAYQGKYDSSATSGAAKQYSINQAAGRLESKRVMKNEAYAKLYELMFKFALAYADQPIPITMSGKDGELEFSHFDKSDFIKFDDAGEPYWNDEFLFTIDTTSTLLTNREAMWNQNDIKLQSGAYGPLGDLRTMRLYWLEQERNGYPHAGEVLAEVEKMLSQQNEMAQAQAQPMDFNQIPMEGEIPNEMPQM
jgi:hypothetical protein